MAAFKGLVWIDLQEITVWKEIEETSGQVGRKNEEIVGDSTEVFKRDR